MLERGGDFVKRFHLRPDRVAVFGTFDVVGTGLDRGFEHLFLIAGALEAALGEAESVKLAWKPNITVDVAEGDAQTLFKLV